MAQLNITTVKPVIEIRTTNAKMQINSRRPRFKVSGEGTKLNISRKAPTFYMDTLQVKAERGTPSSEQQSIQLKAESQQAIMDGTARIATEGARVSALENTNDSVAEVLKSRETRRPTSINVGMVPSDRPPVEWDMGYFNVEWSPDTQTLEWQGEFKPQISVSPHSVEITIKEYGSIKITVDESKLPKVSGKKVDVKM